jgi:hypothetical protein
LPPIAAAVIRSGVVARAATARKARVLALREKSREAL